MLARVLALNAVDATQVVPMPSGAMLAITDPTGRSPLKEGWGAALHEAFGRSDAKASLRLSAEQAARIRWFVESVHLRLPISTLYCSGDGGGARARAVALYAARRYGLPITLSGAVDSYTYFQLCHDPHGARLLNPAVLDSEPAAAIPRIINQENSR